QPRQSELDHRHAPTGRSARGATVGVPVDGHVRPELIDGAGEAGRAEEREDLERLAFERLAAGRVMQERDAMPGPELEEGLLQLQLLSDTRVDERLHRLLAEALQLGRLESAGEPFHTGHAEIVERPGIAV